MRAIGWASQKAGSTISSRTRRAVHRHRQAHQGQDGRGDVQDAGADRDAGQVLVEVRRARGARMGGEPEQPPPAWVGVSFLLRPAAYFGEVARNAAAGDRRAVVREEEWGAPGARRRGAFVADRLVEVSQRAGPRVAGVHREAGGGGGVSVLFGEAGVRHECSGGSVF
jgi:hypothetical protein